MNALNIYRSGLFAVAAALTVVAGAAAQDAGANQRPQPTLNKEVGDWTVQCYARNNVNRCSMFEVLVNKKTGMRVLGISIQYMPEYKRSVIQIGVPLNVALQNGAVLSADGYTSGTLRYSICEQSGCYTVLPADDNVIKGLSGSTKGSMQVVDYPSGKKFAIPFKLDGFSAAYQALLEAASHGATAATTPEPEK